MKTNKTSSLQPPVPARLPGYILNLIVFVCGGSVMVLELVGSRLMAPYLGTSLYVWTSLIGVVLACLSLGYWYGGKLADRRPEPRLLARILFVAGILVALIALSGDLFMLFLQRYITDIRLGAVVGTLLLFGAPSILLGMIAPFAVRLKLTRLEQTGTTAGSLYALSTVGSITGTFLAGFYLLSHFQHASVLFMVSLLLVALSMLAWRHVYAMATAALVAVAISGLSQMPSALSIIMGHDFIEEQTSYNRIWIFDGFIGEDTVRILQLNDTYDSAMYKQREGLVLEYANFYRLAEHFSPPLRHALIIGGGAYSIPRAILDTHTNALCDVVEIDPGLQRISETYFGLQANPRLRIYHEDGRTFLNRTTNKYDLIFSDAIKSYSVPFQLATREAMQVTYDALRDDGVLLMNVIGSFEGEQSQFLRALIATVESVFPRVHLFAVRDHEDGERMQNIIVAATKSDLEPTWTSADSVIDGYLAKRWTRPIKRDLPILTDRFAPVERYAMALINHHADLRNGFVQKTFSEFISR